MGKIEYPIEVNSIEFDQASTVQNGWRCKCGDFVSIRPCADAYKDKTYLGVYIGDIARGQAVSHNKETGNLKVMHTMHNPAIFVPDLGKVIYGMESWWGIIKDEQSLRQITDNDIDNVWYVRALKQLTEAEQETTN